MSAGDHRPGLTLDGLTKRFGSVLAVDGLSMEVTSGEFITLLGPSGCGKTTALRLIAGFETADGGRVLFDGKNVSGFSPQRRGFGMVFQNYALFPHLNVFENVAFGLRARRASRSLIEERVARSLDRVKLAGYGDRGVQQLSGGQQQRIALARALAIEPPLLLLDEPLSNLDAALRERTRSELRALVKELGITALFVTHDQEEAFDLSDRVAVMRDGRLRQLGTPEELYLEPADRFVAGFVGRANVLTGRVLHTGELEWQISLDAGATWTASGQSPGATPGESAPPLEAGATVELLVRPEDLEFAPDASSAAAAAGDGGENRPVGGLVRDTRYRGIATSYVVELSDGSRIEVSAAAGLATPGERVRIRPRRHSRLHIFAPEAV